ncbi:MAG: GNAT family N-acetyltransferase [Nocardioidaceae bacterium]
MLWRVRTTLEDRPGALATLAARCGDEGVNILGLQIFPGVESVTDELVVKAPETMAKEQVAMLVDEAGGRDTTIRSCSAAALVDGPSRFLEAVRRVLDAPSTVEETLADLLDCDAAEAEGPESLTVAIGDSAIVLRRDAPFTATEQTRATIFASVVTDLLADLAAVLALPVEQARTAVEPSPGSEPVTRLAVPGDAMALVRMADRCSSPTLAGRFGQPLVGIQPRFARQVLAEGASLVVEVGQEIVALATVTSDEPARVELLVEDGWQGRGVGSRLLSQAARLAKAGGASDLVLTSAHNSAAVPRLSAASGLSGRVRHVDGRVELTVSLRRVAPLLQAVGSHGSDARGDSAPA